LKSLVPSPDATFDYMDHAWSMRLWGLEAKFNVYYGLFNEVTGNIDIPVDVLDFDKKKVIKYVV
jgi:hypothetical protein